VSILFVLPAFAAESQGTSNPVFQALLAALLETEPRTDVQKVERLDRFLRILQKTFHPETRQIFIKDFSTYLALRNQRFSSPELAFHSYLEAGLVTPLNIRPANPQVMEQIISFEMREMKAFQEFSAKNPHSKLMDPGLQSAALKLLPELFSLGLEMRSTLDTASSQVMQNSFEAAERFRKSHNPLGIFAFAVGAGVGIARSLGENVVNPLADGVLYGTTLQTAVRKKVFNEISNISAWSPERKLALVRQFDNTLEATLSEKVEAIKHHPMAEKWAREIPAEEALRGKLLPFFFENLSARQKSNLVWAVLNDPQFEHKAMPQQMQIALNSMGPLLPFLLRQAAKLPAVKDHEFAKLFCCEKVEGIPFAKVPDLQSEVQKSLETMGYELIKIQDQPLSITAFKQTFQIEVQSSKGHEQWVLQVLKPGIEKSFQDDVKLLRSFSLNTELKTQLSAAGIPDLGDLNESLIQLAQEQIDFKKIQERQELAQRAYDQTLALKVQGKPVQIQLKVARGYGVGERGPRFLFQEMARGQTPAEARRTHPEIVNAVLEAFAENYVKQAFTGSGFLWAEPSERNIRVDIADQGSRATLTFMNVDTSDVLTGEELKSFYANLAKLPLRELLKFQSRSSLDVQQALGLVDQIIESGFKMDASTLKFATGFLHLRALIGSEKFNSLVLRAVSSRPSILWIVLSTKMKQRFDQVFNALAQKFKTSSPLGKASNDSTASVEMRCNAFFAHGSAL
jgi:hypothetical protein